ncbi:fat-like cadherin-related tumor suppressor homolog [Eriocheir sinensis]|uniref:fat-like cadherin-related tumor suppressor homolog n=1 Tax=Eriocheir sinensis TaxID=95602 RepID=UPI0021C8CD75|nr:fat-like cadherin-related tumor suppressor homolog [Eriocheir sinensis]
MPNQWQKAALELALKFRAESNVCAMSGLADILSMCTQGYHSLTQGEVFLNSSSVYLRMHGALTTLVPLDREQQAEYELWVRVSDGQLSSVISVFITVSDVNDNPPEFLEPLYRVTVPARSKTKKREALFRPEPEDAWGDWVSFSPSQITAHDDALFRVFARDADVGMNGDLDYSIRTGKGKKGRFKIHPKTGQVYSNKAFPPSKTFDLMIQVKDNGAPQLTATTRVLVRVMDVPEESPNPPVLQPPPPAHVMETDAPGHLVSFINAQDPDNDTLWYYITEGDESGRFSMGVDSGLVSLARRLDHEEQHHYALTVTATDGVHTAATKCHGAEEAADSCVAGPSSVVIPPIKCTRSSKKIMNAQLSAVMDSAKISDRAVHILAPAAKTLGHDPKELVLIRESFRRDRMKFRA